MARISKKQEMQDKLDRVAQVAEWFRLYAEHTDDDDFANTMVIAAEWVELALSGNISADGLSARMYDGFFGW